MGIKRRYATVSILGILTSLYYYYVERQEVLLSHHIGVQKGPNLKATSVDQQLIEWARKTEDHIMHVMTSYVTADGKVNP